MASHPALHIRTWKLEQSNYNYYDYALTMFFKSGWLFKYFTIHSTGAVKYIYDGRWHIDEQKGGRCL